MSRKVTSAQAVKTSDNVNNNKNRTTNTNPDYHTQQTICVFCCSLEIFHCFAVSVLFLFPSKKNIYEFYSNYMVSKELNVRYKMFYFVALLTFLFLLIADDINYDVRFTAKTWSADLADKQSQGFKDFKAKIVQDVSSGFFFLGGGGRG